VTTLAAWLWQGILIAALTGVALTCARPLNAATRHAIWWLALIAVVVLPFTHLALEPAAAVQPATGQEAESALIVVPAVSMPVIVGAAAVWFGIALFGAVRIAIALARLHSLKNASEPFDSAAERRLTMWMSVRDTGRRPALRVSATTCGACAAGFRRPMILVSRDLRERLADDELDQIVMHEHAHVARLDDWGRLAQALIASLVGLHPAIYFINRQIDLEREAACDDRVVARSGAARRYATCLTDAAAHSTGVPSALATAIGSPSTLHKRVQRLLDPARRHTPRPASLVCIAAAILFVVILTISREFGTAVRFAEPAPVVSPPVEAAATVAQRTVPLPPSAIVVRSVPRAGGPSVPASAIRSESQVVVTEPQRAIEERGSTAPAVLANRMISIGDASRPPHVSALDGALAATPPASSDAPWMQAANAGAAIGSGAKRSGLAVGGFFTRAGKAIARSF